MKLILTLILAVGVLAVVTRPLWACCLPSLQVSEMPARAEGVPTNVRYWVAVDVPRGVWARIGDDDPVLVCGELCSTTTRWEFRSRDSSSIAGVPSFIHLEDGILMVVSPAHELEADSAYELVCEAPSFYPSVLAEFTTGSGPDFEAPPVPAASILSVVSHAGPAPDSAIILSTGGPAHAVEFDVRFEDFLVVVRRADRSDFSAGHLSGSLVTASSLERVLIGSTPCTETWPGAAEGELIEVQFGALDRAGNFSGWSDTVSVRIPAHDGGL